MAAFIIISVAFIISSFLLFERLTNAGRSISHRRDVSTTVQDLQYTLLGIQNCANITANRVFHRSIINESFCNNDCFRTGNSTHKLKVGIAFPSIFSLPVWARPLGFLPPGLLHGIIFSQHEGKLLHLGVSKDGLRFEYFNSIEIYFEDGSVASFHHIASPEIFFHDAHQALYLFFHYCCSNLSYAPAYARSDVSLDKFNQRSLVARYNTYLKRFTILEPAHESFVNPSNIMHRAELATIGPFYLRLFSFNNEVFAIAKERNRGSLLLKSNGIGKNFTAVRRILGGSRHVGVVVVGNELLIAYSKMHDAPEVIYLKRVLLKGDSPLEWNFNGADTIFLYPTEIWEGCELPSQATGIGPVYTHQRNLRDPYFFINAGKLLLAYVGGGEQGIGLAVVSCQTASSGS